MVSKYGHLWYPGAFPDKVNPDIDFTDEVDVPVVSCKSTFVRAGNLQIFTNKF